MHRRPVKSVRLPADLVDAAAAMADSGLDLAALPEVPQRPRLRVSTATVLEAAARVGLATIRARLEPEA